MKIYEIFYSLQGEGIKIGLPTTFIRTSGCNLRCKWCDTKYAYEGGKEMKPKEILKGVMDFTAKHVCITGGEPLIQTETINLISLLDDRGYRISIETNGSVPIEPLLKWDSLLINTDIKCPSSDMAEKMDFSNISRLRKGDQLKFVIADEEDYSYAKNIIVKYRPVCNIIMIPVHGTDLKALSHWVLMDGLDVRVLPQLHKIIWGEKQGV